MQKTFLLIGGAGYIGSHVALKLKDENQKVIIFDNLYSGNLDWQKNDIFFVNGDHNNIEQLDKVFSENKIDTVIHLSAFIKVGESVQKPLDYYNNNLNGILNVLSSMKKHNVNKLIFSSTAAVYGQGNSKPAKEDDLKEPINPYGSSKLFCEQIIQDYARTNPNFKFGILRYFNVAGADPKQRSGIWSKENKYSLLIPVLANNHLNKIQSTIFGNDYNTPDKTCVRDYIHVCDLANAHYLLDQYLEENKSDIFNVGSNKGYSNLDVINAFNSVLGENLNYVFGPRREGDPDFLVADSNKIKQKLNFIPMFNLKDMVEHEIKWRKSKLKF